MANDMRKEFEDYVKKLTTAICKEIFLEKLEELYQKYNSEYERYSQAASLAEKAGKSLEDEVGKAVELVRSIDKNTNRSVASVNKEIVRVEEGTKQLFSEMRVFNAQKSEEFIAELAKYIDGYKSELSLVFEEENRKISDKLAGIITPEILQSFLDSLRENTAETKNLASFVSGEYKKEVEKSIRGIVEANRKAMESTNMMISEYVRRMIGELQISQKGVLNNIDQMAKNVESTNGKYMAVMGQYFKKLAESEKAERDAAIEEQKNLIAQIGPSDEKMNRLEQSVIRLEKTVDELRRENETYKRKLWDIVERLSRKEENFEEKLSFSIESIKEESCELSENIGRRTGVVAVCAVIFLLIGAIKMYGWLGIIILVLMLATGAVLSPKIRRSIIKIIKDRQL